MYNNNRMKIKIIYYPKSFSTKKIFKNRFFQNPMGDVEFCENESEEVDKTLSTLFVTRLLPKKKFFETIEVFWWRPGFFEKR